MKKVIAVLACILAPLLVLVVLFGFVIYNRIVTLDIISTSDWKQLQVQYQAHFDLIPDFVQSVQGVMKQDQSLFTAVATTSTAYSNATSSDQKIAAANQVEASLHALVTASQGYSVLKSSDTVQLLISELTNSQNMIGTKEIAYNNDVAKYNHVISSFPGSLVGWMFGYEQKPYFGSSNM